MFPIFSGYLKLSKGDGINSDLLCFFRISISLITRRSISLWQGFHVFRIHITSQRVIKRPEDLLSLNCKTWNEIEKKHSLCNSFILSHATRQAWVAWYRLLIRWIKKFYHEIDIFQQLKYYIFHKNTSLQSGTFNQTPPSLITILKSGKNTWPLRNIGQSWSTNIFWLGSYNTNFIWKQ